MKSRYFRAFTLIELLVVIAIIAMLVSLTIPHVGQMIERARSATCMGNLKNIGVATTSYLSEHDNTFPYTEINTTDPIYPTNFDALPMEEILGPYGINAKVLRCPSDVAGPNYFAARTNSYMWAPVADGETTVNIEVLGRRGALRVVKPSRVRICTDYDSVHFGKLNRLYADGHVVWVAK